LLATPSALPSSATEESAPGVITTVPLCSHRPLNDLNLSLLKWQGPRIAETNGDATQEHDEVTPKAWALCRSSAVQCDMGSRQPHGNSRIEAATKRVDQRAG
jgi:hypothetical protein